MKDASLRNFLATANRLGTKIIFLLQASLRYTYREITVYGHNAYSSSIIMAALGQPWNLKLLLFLRISLGKGSSKNKSLSVLEVKATILVSAMSRPFPKLGHKGGGPDSQKRDIIDRSLLDRC